MDYAANARLSGYQRTHTDVIMPGMADTDSPEFTRLYEAAAKVDGLAAVRVLWKLSSGEIGQLEAEQRLVHPDC